MMDPKTCEFTTGIPHSFPISMWSHGTIKQPGVGDVRDQGISGVFIHPYIWCIYIYIYTDTIVFVCPLCLYVYIFRYAKSSQMSRVFVPSTYTNAIIFTHPFKTRHRQNHQSWWSPRCRTSGELAEQRTLSGMMKPTNSVCWPAKMDPKLGEFGFILNHQWIPVV